MADIHESSMPRVGQVRGGLADQVLRQIEHVPGIKEVGILRNVGQPELSVILDRERMAAYGTKIADAQAVLEMAFGGKTATQKYEG